MKLLRENSFTIALSESVKGEHLCIGNLMFHTSNFLLSDKNILC